MITRAKAAPAQSSSTDLETQRWPYSNRSMAIFIDQPSYPDGFFQWVAQDMSVALRSRKIERSHASIGVGRDR
ncbi:hypothetical protein ACFU6I_03100 [Streptomyces sp. NPDC057486]|uniref:hypothetical protein n=1 Tax=Streptomyces sp. NPDC057486 TaxID=3346145 RepID=UPI0036C01946